jgi:UDP-2,3-diacylglucosamine hydrolase
MNPYSGISASEVLFLADTHFRDRELPGEAERRRRFIRFMEGIRSGAAVFLLGDIFDFYMEYGSVIPRRFFDIFHVLYDCRLRGIEVHFLGGNHDYWVADFFRDEIGVQLHEGNFLFECQGRRVWCSHGDLLVPGKLGYRILRPTIRNPLMIRMAKALHPDFLDAIARHFSKYSKKRNAGWDVDAVNHFVDSVADRCFSQDNDVFIMGHVHFPLHRVEKGREFVVLGDWIESFSYGRLVDGKMTLETFDG